MGSPHRSLAANILAAAIAADEHSRSGSEIPVPLLELVGFDPSSVRRVRTLLGRNDESARIRSIPVDDLRAGMVLAADVTGPNGLLLAIRGQLVSDALAVRLRESWMGASRGAPIEIYGGAGRAT